MVRDFSASRADGRSLRAPMGRLALFLAPLIWAGGEAAARGGDPEADFAAARDALAAGRITWMEIKGPRLITFGKGFVLMPAAGRGAPGGGMKGPGMLSPGAIRACLPINFLFFEDVAPHARALAEAHGASLVPFLEGKVGDADPDADRLARMTLAALATDRVARQAIVRGTDPLLGKGGVPWAPPQVFHGLCMPLTHLAPADALAIGRAILREEAAKADPGPGRAPARLLVAMRLLAIFGERQDDGDLASLTDRFASIRPAIAADRHRLRSRLQAPQAAQEQWMGQELALWRVEIHGSLFRENAAKFNPTSCVHRVLAAGTRFTPDFLKARLIHWGKFGGTYDDALAQVVCQQGPARALPLLEALAEVYAADPDYWREHAPNGDPGRPIDLMQQIFYQGEASDRPEICRLLALYGNDRTVGFLRSVIAMPGWRPEERVMFERTKREIESRLQSR